MPFRRRNHDRVDRLLGGHRPEPREDFVRDVLSRLQSEPRRSVFRRRVLGGRIALAGALSVLALAAATVAAGGVGAASHGVAGAVATSAHTVGLGNSSSNNDNSKKSDSKNENGKDDDRDGNGKGDDERDEGPGVDEVGVEICHATSSDKNPYVELLLSPQGTKEHLLHHSGDFVEPSSGCPSEKEHKNH
jgi:hypothetical protein